MGAAGGECNQRVARLHTTAVDNVGALHNAHTKARQIVILTLVHPGHFSGFTAHECGTCELTAFADTGHNRCGHVDIQFAGGVVIEKKQRFSAHDGDVVAAHGHEVNAYGVMDTQIHRQLQFGTYAIGSRYQHGFRISRRDRA